MGYADKLQNAPNQKYKIRERTGFAFSDVRRIIFKTALDSDFNRVCPLPGRIPQKAFVNILLRMVA